MSARVKALVRVNDQVQEFILRHKSDFDHVDGHRKVIVEHTLHIVLLPGMHSSSSQQGGLTPSFSSNISDRSISFPSSTRVLQQIGQRTTLGLNLSLPSPLHLRLPIVSRLSFNDAGKITYHRDFWDVKVCIKLLPCNGELYTPSRMNSG